MNLFSCREITYGDILAIPALEIEAGKVTALTGPSGGGKTTFLKLLNKLISPDSGEILFRGDSLATINSVEHRREVVLLSQNAPMFGGTVADNLLAGLRFQGKTEPDEARLMALLGELHLEKKLTDSADKLSGGERQRVALGRLLLLKPSVYLLDEPSSALDRATEKLIVELVIRCAKESDSSIIMVTHSPEMVHQFANKAWLLKKSHPAEELKL